MISYAGIELVIDDKYQSLQRYLESLGHSAIPPIEQFNRWYADFSCPIRLPYFDMPEIGLNQFYFPTGAHRPAFGHFLVDRKVVNLFDVLPSPNSIQEHQEHQELVISEVLEEERTILGPDNWVGIQCGIVACTPLFNFQTDEELYVLTLGDRRWFNRMQTESKEYLTSAALAGRTVSAALPYYQGDQNAAQAGASVSNMDPSRYIQFSGEQLYPAAWASLNGDIPSTWITEAIVNAYAHRGTPQLDKLGSFTRLSKVWSQSEDDALWTAVQNKVVAGGRMTPGEVYRTLPDDYRVYFRDGSFYDTTLSAIVGSTVTGNRNVGRINSDRRTAETTHAFALARNWVENHFGTIDCTLAGVKPLPLTAGVDHVLITHRVDEFSTRIARWGNQFELNFSYEPVAPVYAIGERAQASPQFPVGGLPVRLKYDGVVDTLTIPAGTSYPEILSVDIPRPDLYEIEVHLYVEGGKTDEVGSLSASVVSSYGTTYVNSTQATNFILNSTSAIPTPLGTSYILQSPGFFSMKWTEALAVFGNDGLPQDPPMKLRIAFINNYSSQMQITVKANLTATPIGERVLQEDL